jgi:hypothetical protein
MFQCEPDDPRIFDMDPVKRAWMYHNWLADYADDAELAKNHAYLLGSFWNPEAVKKLMGSGTTHSTTDEEFEKSTAIVERARKFNSNKEEKPRKRKRKLKE